MSLSKEEFSRSEMLLGSDAIDKLRGSRVAIFGIGGVGGFAAEALARAGVGNIDIVDSDEVSLSNINRQIFALHSTIGKSKTDVAKERIADINPDCIVKAHKVFFTPDTADEFNFLEYDYVIDAIDTVTGKKQLILSCKSHNVPIISAMGAGNKLDPTAFKVADIYKTKVCPLARVMRRICKENNIEHLKVVYSEEPPVKQNDGGIADGEKAVPGSVSFVPPVCGLIIAGEVIKDLTK